MTATVPIGSFTTVRCIYKRSTLQMIIYVDGVLANTLNVANFNSVTTEARELNLGTLSTVNGTQPLLGSIDYIKVTEF